MRNYLYCFLNPHGNATIINYDVSNDEVNTLLHCFDCWGSYGERKFNAISGECTEIWFECSKEFYNFAHSRTFIYSMRRMNIYVVFYPFDNN